MAGDPTEFHVAGSYQPLMRQLGLDAETVFDHADIQVWRKLPDRDNCRLDSKLPDGNNVRLHIKRYRSPDAVEPEIQGQQLLESAEIPTAALVGWGKARGRGSFVIFDDLTGFTPADKLLEQGIAFAPLLQPTAELAAQLHAAGLHHRDLYLCHFMARITENKPELRLIDVARVKRLSKWFARRWIVKDLAQFWYSTLKHPVTEEQRRQWLSHYASCRRLADEGGLTKAIERKVRSIARHDARLHQNRPERDVSIPSFQEPPDHS